MPGRLSCAGLWGFKFGGFVGNHIRPHRTDQAACMPAGTSAPPPVTVWALGSFQSKFDSGHRNAPSCRKNNRGFDGDLTQVSPGRIKDRCVISILKCTSISITEMCGQFDFNFDYFEYVNSNLNCARVLIQLRPYNYCLHKYGEARRRKTRHYMSITPPWREQL